MIDVVKYPEQWEEWQKIDKETFEMAVKKSADYSPSNILGLGDMGVMFIIISKVARLCNLFGINLYIKFEGMNPPHEPNYESLEDNIKDLRNYAQIMMVLRRNKWGK